MLHLLSYILFILQIISFIKCEENQPIKYELSVTVPREYTYKKTQEESNIITTEENAFSITILSDVPKLRKGMLQIDFDTYYFWLDGHKLEEIEPGAFDNQNITEEIRLETNNLTIIRTGTFKNLQIKKLDLAYNQIQSIEPQAIINLPNLWEVHLSRNQIVEFSDNSFVNTPKMWAFDISYNKLKKLGPKWFSFMDKERTNIFGAAYNEIEEIHPDTFKSIKLFNLDLSHNKIATIPTQILSGNELIYLHLEGNYLEILPDAFFEQKALQEVDLRNNTLSCSIQNKLKKLQTQIRIFMFDTNNC